MWKKRIAHWITEAGRALCPRPGREATTVGVMAAILENLDVDPHAWFLAPGAEGIEDRLNRAVDLQLDHYRALLAGETVIVFWVFEDFLSNVQQVAVARDLLDDGRYPVVFLITNRWRSLDEFHVDDVFCGHQPLYFPDRDRLDRIDFASVFWAIDCLYDTALPRGAVRLLQPHGTDIQFDYSVDFYGAGLLFDHLLSPSFEPELFRPDYRARYEGVLPRCLADHAAPALHALNIGSFKLDQFARRCRNSTPADIIYNLSAWDLEHARVKHELTATLQEILRRHPDRRLVFRNFPGDEAAVRPHIAPLLEQPRFFWSTAPTYIDDYAGGAALIHHRGSSAEIFSVASGRPSIRLDYFEPYADHSIETSVGWLVHDHGQLWTALAEALRPDTPKCAEIRELRARKYPALGRGMELVLDSIPAMLAGRADPAWRTLPLAETPAGLRDEDFVRQALGTALRRDILIPILAQRALALLPHSALAHFYAAKSLFTHIYPDPMRDDDPWLAAVEHYAEYHRRSGAPGAADDMPEDLREGVRDWASRFMPARLIGLVGRGARMHDAQQAARLGQALRALPLDFFATDGLPQWMEATARGDSRERDALSDKVRAAEASRPVRFVLTPLAVETAAPGNVYLADPFLAYRTRWDKALAAAPGVREAAAAPWRNSPPEEIEALNAALTVRIEALTKRLCAGLDAAHAEACPRASEAVRRGPRFWRKALGMGPAELVHLLWECFALFEAEYRPERHETVLLDPAGYFVPLDFDDLRWFLQHSDFGLEQVFSVYARALHPGALHRTRLLRYQSPYRVRNVGEPTKANPRVGILGAFPAAPYMERLVAESGGEIAQIGFTRERGLYATPVQHDRRQALFSPVETPDRFDRFLTACLPWLLPLSMLENFAELERGIEADLAAHTRLTHVVSEFWIGESYECLALAVLSRRGVRHVYNEHVMSCAPFSASLLHDHRKICDLYVASSTEPRPELPNLVPAGSLYDFCATPPEARPARVCTYFSAKPFARTVGHSGQDCAIGRGPWAKPYYDWKRRFFRALPEQAKARMTYRRYPYDDFFRLANLAWDDEAMMRAQADVPGQAGTCADGRADGRQGGLLDGCTVDDHVDSAREAIAASGLVLTDQFSTSFLEALALDRPTVLLLHNAAVFTPGHARLMQRLLACGMVQDDAEAGACFVAQLLAGGAQAWWRSEEVRQVRQQVLETFLGEPERTIQLLLALARGEEEPRPARPLADFVCANPFLYAELRSGGQIAPCCYLDMSFGSIHEAPLAEVWNSPQAEALRASILDGSYRYCDAARCAGMQKALRRAENPEAAPPRRYQLPYELAHRSELADLGLGWVFAWTPGEAAPAPRIISLEDDPSCNLRCPSCRTQTQVLPRAESDQLMRVHAGLPDQLAQGGELWLCGAGDPFASRAYRAFLEDFDPAAHPGLRLRIDTNGQLLTPEMWAKTLGRYPERVSVVAVSVDAAEAATHERLRRGGNWRQLLCNLEFLGQRRRENPGMTFLLRMIVQRDNFRQMPAFSRLAREVGADRAVFSALENWGSFADADWQDRAVHRPEHPRHDELLAILRHPDLAGGGLKSGEEMSTDIDLGNLTQLIPANADEASGDTGDASAPQSKRALALAFHLPQFHPIPENDQWWGKGFTEWTNTAKAVPLFEGHEQPHVPADLGFYDLRLPEARAAQAELAREYGLDGFVYWHYWFGNGRRLLERPVEEIVRSGEPDFPFCLGWANQTWSGIWHGAPGRVLMEQVYPGPEDELAHFEALAQAFADPRYVKIEGRNLFLVYNPSGLPDATAFTRHWRALARERGLPDFHFVEHGSREWVGRGFDSCVDNAPFINFNDEEAPVRFLDPEVRPTVREYAAYVRQMAQKDLPPEEHPLAVHAWDNTPRSGGRGHALVGSTPELFGRHLRDLLTKIAHRPRSRRVLFLKSWNEWAEGNHLEPDVRWGRAYLEALRDALTEQTESEKP
jgi:Lipopolysaccharide biosynthesis protein